MLLYCSLVLSQCTYNELSLRGFQMLSKPENCCGLKESEVLSLLNDVGMFIVSLLRSVVCLAVLPCGKIWCFLLQAPGSSICTKTRLYTETLNPRTLCCRISMERCADSLWFDCSLSRNRLTCVFSFPAGSQDH